jgi:serine/threonine-protein kinase
VSSNKIGRYQIVREIARSNDIVYEAVDPSMGRRVAVKELLLPPNLVGAQKRERIERFYREAKAAGTLTHPNIVTIYEVGEDQGRHFIAMEYLEGHSLRDQLQMQCLVSVPEALRIGIAIGEALRFAHEHGVIHRDVKPDNVHLLPDGRVKLTDFGIARLMFESTLTANGQVFGTPSYMSPEQVQGKALDARSDLFSLGVMLYEMVAGRKPFSGDSVITITYNIMNLMPAKLTGVPPEVDRIVARAMAKDPSLRYRNAADMVDEMRTVLQNSGSAARSPALRSSASLASGTRASGPQPLSRSTPARSAPAPSSPALPASVNAAAQNPFAHLQPADMWFPRPARRPRAIGPGTRAALGNVLLVAIVAGILWFLFWSTMTAYQEFLYAGNRSEALQVAEKAKVEFDAGRFGQAAALYERAWRLDPRPPNGVQARENAAIAAITEGDRRYKQGQAAEAHRWYRQAMTYDRSYPGAYHHLAILLYQQGQMSQADSLWQQSIELWNRRLASVADAGVRYEYERSLEQVQRDAATAWWNRGEFLLRGNRVAEAQQAWSRAVHYGAGTEIAVQAQQRLNAFGGMWGGGI